MEQQNKKYYLEEKEKIADLAVKYKDKCLKEVEENKRLAKVKLCKLMIITRNEDLYIS